MQTHILTDIQTFSLIYWQFSWHTDTLQTYIQTFSFIYCQFSWNTDTYSDRHTDIFFYILTVLMTYRHIFWQTCRHFFLYIDSFYDIQTIFWQTYRHFHSCIDSFHDIQTHILTDIQTFSLIHWQFSWHTDTYSDTQTPKQRLQLYI